MSTNARTRAVIVERDMPHPPEKIWRALTQGALIAEWLMKNDFAPVVGRKFQLRSTPMPGWSGVIDCEVTIVEPQTRLAYTWVAGTGALHLTSVVTWTLTPTKAGTLVRMEQSGFGEDQVQNYQGAQHGWQRFCAGLERVAGTVKEL